MGRKNNGGKEDKKRDNRTQDAHMGRRDFRRFVMLTVKGQIGGKKGGKEMSGNRKGRKETAQTYVPSFLPFLGVQKEWDVTLLSASMRNRLASIFFASMRFFSSAYHFGNKTYDQK